MKFLVDAQLPPALAAWLRRSGFEAVHVCAASLEHATGEVIRRYAGTQSFVLITKDRDFVSPGMSSSDPSVLWVRTGNVPNAILLRRLEMEWPRICALFEAGSRVVELR